MTENKFRSSWKAKCIVFALLLTMTAWLMPVGLWEAQAAEPAQNEAGAAAVKEEAADSNGADAAKAAARDERGEHAAKKAHAGVKSTDIVKEVKPGEAKNVGADAKAAALRSPRVDSNGKVTWDCVWFGHYPQSKNGSGGFSNDPIKWRVLSVDGNDAFLLADKNLDVQPYNEKWVDITWENCTLRSWLNSTFLDKAFSSGEQSAVRQTNVINSDNPKYGTSGGNNTMDKVYLLSIAEAMKPAYGFTSNYDDTKTRQAVNTAYTASKPYMSNEGKTDYWWLRSPGGYSNYAASVDYNGYLSYCGRHVDDGLIAVRPALHLNLSSNLYSYAGTVSSDGGMNEEEGGTPDVPEEPDGTLSMTQEAVDAEVDTPCYILADLKMDEDSSFDPKTDLVWKSSNDSVLKFEKYSCIESADDPNDILVMAEFKAQRAGTVTASVQLGSRKSECTVTVANLSLPVKNASMYTPEEWKDWLNSSARLAKYLSTPKNYLHVRYISNHDGGVFGRFEYLFANAIKIGEGWRELLKEDASRADAEKILYALLEESDKEVKSLSSANTAKNISSTLNKVLKKYLESEAYDVYLTQRISQYMSTDQFQKELTGKGLDAALNTILNKVDDDSAAKLKNTFKDFKVSKELTNGLKGLGIGLDILDLSKVSFDTYAQYLKIREANELYFDMLKYIQENAEVQVVCDAAKTLSDRAKMNEKEAMFDIAKQIAATKGADKAVGKLMQKCWFLEAAKLGVDAGSSLSNLFFHTHDIAKLQSSMRVTAYVGQSIAGWTAKKFQSAARNLNYADAEATMFGLESLVKVRKLGETSLKNLAVYINDKRGEEVAIEVISKLDSDADFIQLIEKYDLSQLKVACPVDVQIFDKNNRLVKTVYDGEETSGKIGDVYYYSYYSRCADDYIKVISAPKDAGYTYKVKGQDLGKVSASISEVDSEGNVQTVSFDENIDRNKSLQIGSYETLQDATYQLMENDEVKEEKPFTKDEPEKSISVTGIEAFTPEAVEIREEEKALIDYRVAPANASNQLMEWSSSNERVAEVNQDGVVTGISPGTAQITAVSEDGEFEKTCEVTVTAKAKQTITAKSYTKTYGNKAFSLNAKAKGKLSYKSSNKAVATVSSAGKVTLKGPGKATITITAASTASYKSATKKITVTVKPKKAALSKVTSPKGGTLKAAWKRDAKATGYQVVIASNSKFTKGKKTFTASSNKTVAKTFTKLKKKTTYYVKVRAYKKVGSMKLYGAYSTVKKVKVK